ncbi:MAG: choline monooxygenase [Gammaproteobacteria bacterium]|jgi:choline monooxygenase
MSALYNPEKFQLVRKPLLEASTLPSDVYTSDEFFDMEKREIFLKQWLFTGHISQVRELGQYYCYDSFGGPLIIMRTGSDTIKAYTNSCRHRGSKLLDGEGVCKRIVCPYHSWTYQLDGALSGAPQMDQVIGFDSSDFSLLEIPLEICNGLIFINYQKNPIHFDKHMGNFSERFKNHSAEKMRLIENIHFSVNCNWKLLTENALEAYHTGTVHRDTLGPQESVALNCRGNWCGLKIVDEDSVATMKDNLKPFDHIQGLTEDDKSGAFFTVVYPSTQFVFAQDCIWWLSFKPITVDRTDLTIGACFPVETIGRVDFKEQLALYRNRWTSATQEDNQICESQFKGQKINRPPGRFSHHEFAVHAFDNWILDQILEL